MTQGVTWRVLYEIVAKPLCLPFLILARPKVRNNFVRVILTELVFWVRSEPAWIRWEWIQNRQERRFGEGHDEISF